jgi:hypothetical protein
MSDPFASLDPLADFPALSSTPKPKPTSSRAGQLGTITFQPRGATSIYRGTINGPQSIMRDDNSKEYRGVLEFIDAIEREVLGLPPADTSSTLSDVMARFTALGRANAMGDLTEEEEENEDNFDPFKLGGDSNNRKPGQVEHGNVWL